MASALRTLVPVASKAGLNFEEIVALMSTLKFATETRQGINVQTATMQLQQVINNLKFNKEKRRVK